MMGRVDSRHLVAISLVLFIGFSIAAPFLDAQSLWRDEVDALRFAAAPRAELLSSFTRHGWNGPLYHLMLRGWISLTGTSAYGMRFFSLAFGLLSVPLIYALGRRLFNPSTGVIAAVLAMGSPYLTWYSQEVKMYTLVLAFVLLAIYSLRRALDTGSWRWWVTQFTATALALYVHIFAALLIPVQLLMCVVWWSRLRKRWGAALISFAGLILPYLPLVIWQAPLALQARDTGFSAYPLHQMVVILLNGWSAGISGWGRPWIAVLMGILGGGAWIAGVIRPCVSRDAGDDSLAGAYITDYLAIGVWLSVPLVVVWIISLRQPLFTDRYLIWCAPAFYLLVALMLSRLVRTKDWRRWCAGLLVSAILVVNVANVQRQVVTPIKADFRGAAAYVAGYEQAAEAIERSDKTMPSRFRSYLPMVAGRGSGSDALMLFQIPYGRYTFDYYFPTETYPAAEGLYTNHQSPEGEYLLSEQQVAWHMREMTQGFDEVWLIATEVTMWDGRNLVHRWLDEQFQRVAHASFVRVEVYRYVRPTP